MSKDCDSQSRANCYTDVRSTNAESCVGDVDAKEPVYTSLRVK